jgi:TfoX/Sxy family transcriptional regulator of competence genes
MAYDEKLAERVRALLAGLPEIISREKFVVEKKMMGGLAFMVNDKMCLGIVKDDLMARIDPDAYDTAMKREGCREMDFTGRPMKGFVFVGPTGTGDKKSLSYWINLAMKFNDKAKASPKKKRKPFPPPSKF